MKGFENATNDSGNASHWRGTEGQANYLIEGSRVFILAISAGEVIRKGRWQCRK